MAKPLTPTEALCFPKAYSSYPPPHPILQYSLWCSKLGGRERERERGRERGRERERGMECVCVCVCVWDGEREGKKERGRERGRERERGGGERERESDATTQTKER